MSEPVPTFRTVRLRIDGRWKTEYLVFKPFFLPECAAYPGGWLKYGERGAGRIKPENWRYEKRN